MIGHLGKLEAEDNGDASVVAPSATNGGQPKKHHAPAVQDRRLLTMPTDGWIGGPGRTSHLPAKFALAEG